jgi:cytochrome c oxidase subunit I+III
VLALGVLVFMINAARSLRAGAPAPANPWGAGGLEWAVSSPPPPSAEREVLVVPSRYPLWIGELGRVVGLQADEQLVTRAVDAEPDHAVKSPIPNLMPFFAALMTAGMILACLFTPWGLPAGVVLVSATLFVWFWPTDREPSLDSRARIEDETTTLEGSS